jgi:tRNA threonylcarbamoyl adenosine modification protein YeaZ
MALDLSTPQGILVLEGSAGLLYRTIEGGARVSMLFVAAAELATEAGIKPGDITSIGVSRGPGSFTGVRVAVTAAKVLADVLRAPLAAPDSLEVTAMAAGRKEAAMVALDARRGEVYYAFYGFEGGYPSALEGPRVGPPEEAAEALTRLQTGVDGEVALLGTGVSEYPEVWPEGVLRIDREHPTPEGLARLCRRYLEKGWTTEAIGLLPLYIRYPDAQPRFTEKKGEGNCS